MTHLLTTTQAAERLNTPVATLRWWRHIGYGPKSFKISTRKVMYKSDDIEDWLDTRYSETEPAA